MEISTEDTYKVLSEFVNNPNLGDTFRVRVNHKATPSSIPSSFGIFANVTFEQITTPEPWIEKISSNARGFFEILVSHESATSKSLGGVIRVPMANGRSVEPKFDWAALEREDYTGPRTVVYPTKPEPQAGAVTSSIARPVDRPAGGAPPSQLGELVPLLQQMITREKEKPGVDPFARYLEMQAEDRRRDEQRRADERAREEKREEREEQRRREEQKEAREREDRREERERAYRLEITQQQQKSTDMLLQVLTREPPKNPVIDTLLAKALNGGDEANQKAAAVIGQMGMVTQQVMGMTLQLIHTQAELTQSAAPEHPMWGIAGKLVEGYFGTISEQQGELDDALEAGDNKKTLPVGNQQEEVADDEQSEDAGESAPPPEEDRSGDEPSVEDPLQRLDRAIRQEAPLRELADALCLALVTDGFQVLYKEAKGNVQVLISNRYGKWLESTDVEAGQRKATALRRLKYLSVMLPKAWSVAKQRGILKPPPAPPAKKDAHAKAQPQKKANLRVAPVPKKVSPETTPAPAPEADPLAKIDPEPESA